MPHQHSETVVLCQELIRQPSITPNDSGCQKILAQRLANIGFSIEHMPFNDVSNMWARCGDTGPLFVFAGHTDVVPVGDPRHWSSDPFAADIRDGKIYGRGAADMKGSIAAMVTALERVARASGKAAVTDNFSNGSIALLITSDEEGPALDGTARVVDVLKQRDETIDWCLVGEPTSVNVLGDTIKNGRRGSLGGLLTIKGTQGHVAYPHLADNPIHRALQPLLELTQIEWDKGNEHFPATTLQISNVNAGTGAGNVIPATISVQFNLRFSPEVSSSEIRDRCEKILAQHDVDFDLQWSLSGDPFITSPGTLTNAVSAAINSVCAIDARLDTGGGTSDGRFIATMGCQVIELGPSNATIHQIDENVAIEELDTLSEIYEKTIWQLFG